MLVRKSNLEKIYTYIVFKNVKSTYRDITKLTLKDNIENYF